MIKENLEQVKTSLKDGVNLVAVSKTKPISDLMQAYDAGQRVFGENKVQELCDKHEEMPKDIEWHMIGHLQRNKVKYIVPFVSLIHGVDSERLLVEINKQAVKYGVTVNCLLQLHVAQEQTKFGFSFQEVTELLNSKDFESRFSNVKIKGLMAMATNTPDEDQLRKEFSSVKDLSSKLKTINKLNLELEVVSMGMSGDYKIAMEEGSNMVRVGSTIFGKRNYPLIP